MEWGVGGVLMNRPFCTLIPAVARQLSSEQLT